MHHRVVRIGDRGPGPRQRRAGVRDGDHTCNGSVVHGIGVRNAAMVYMETLNRKVYEWSHEEARRASMEAGQQLFGCEGLRAVRDAWNAVGVPRHPDEPTC
ncbi:M4 family metallopeptidase [Nonomuraea sp. NPDC049158]|uniref:M4 family metallopeptidase n=1 Tax=Nonomuraea sp. NPDC049158 TaxID=3155649 RepID=UPI00340AA4C5